MIGAILVLVLVVLLFGTAEISGKILAKLLDDPENLE